MVIMKKNPIDSMPGIDRLTPDLVIDKAKKVYSLGVPAIALFHVLK